MIHVMRDGQQFGPYTIEDLNAYLAQGSLLPTDQAWWEGAPAWVPMDQVPGVILPGGVAPAPVPVATAPVVADPNDPLAAANPEVAAAEAASVSAANAGSRKKKFMIIGGAVAGVGALAGVLLFVWPGFLKEKDSVSDGGDNGGGGAPAAGGDTYAAAIEPIFKAHNCYDCHDGSAGNPKGNFDLMQPDTVTPFLTDGTLVQRLADAGDPMPPEGKGEMLSTEEVEKVKAWIAAGGKF